MKFRASDEGKCFITKPSSPIIDFNPFIRLEIGWFFSKFIV
jgi:hypothetical protein